MYWMVWLLIMLSIPLLAALWQALSPEDGA
jgi:hypothetical protein